MKLKSSVVPLMLIVVASLALPTNLFAQTTSWTSVKALPRGADVIVERKASDRVIGYLQSATDDTVAVTSDTGSFVISRDNVQKIFYAVSRDRKKIMNRGALYGMLLGLAAGVAVSTVQEPESEAMPGTGAFIAGGLIGMWAGHKHAKGKDKGPLIYSAK
ncbi:MAG TPA: hypothetical protein VFZ23_15425 [Pyrinomonadaceae bacterium]